MEARQIRKRVKRAKKEAMDIDITSLLDILVVLLIFLLKNYSTSNVIINVPEEIKLPKSQSQEINTEGITLQVSSDKIFLENQEVVNNIKAINQLVDETGLNILPLYNELVRKREAAQNLEKQVEGAKPFSGMVNLVMDKKVKYDFLRKLMFTCGEAGYQKFKFVVLSKND